MSQSQSVTNASQKNGAPSIREPVGDDIFDEFRADQDLAHPATGRPPGSRDPAQLKQFAHDARHEISTISLLASLIHSAPDIDGRVRRRARQMLYEISWLEELIRGLDDEFPVDRVPPGSDDEIELDEIVTAMATTLRYVYPTRLVLDIVPARTRIDRLVLWRILRNLLCNALTAAGPDGTVAVLVRPTATSAVIEIDDDGPGDAPDGPLRRTGGLGIVRDLTAEAGAHVTIGRGPRAGWRARLLLPGWTAADRDVADEADASFDLR